MTRKNIIAQHVYTAQRIHPDFPEMRGGDIFMGAFNAEQVMYNHFGYRTPVGRLYMAGSACHPGGAISGGAGYISAGIIARDLGLEAVVEAVDAGDCARRRTAGGGVDSGARASPGLMLEEPSEARASRSRRRYPRDAPCGRSSGRGRRSHNALSRSSRALFSRQ